MSGFQSIPSVEAALRGIGFAETAPPDSAGAAYERAARSCERALDALLADAAFWNALRKPRPTERRPWEVKERVVDLVTDAFGEQLVKVGYQPPPAQAHLLDLLRELVVEALAADPATPPEELIGAARTNVVYFRRALGRVPFHAGDGAPGASPARQVAPQIKGLLSRLKVFLLSAAAAGALVGGQLAGGDVQDLVTAAAAEVVGGLVVYTATTRGADLDH